MEAAFKVIAEIVPGWALATVGLLFILESMAISAAITMKRLDATDHPIYDPLKWLIGLPPIGVLALVLSQP